MIINRSRRISSLLLLGIVGLGIIFEPIANSNYSNILDNMDFSEKRILTAPRSHAIMEEIYVSPSGDDGNLGSLASPLKTIAAAQVMARAIAPMTGDIVIYLRGGTYPLDSTWQLNQSDSGRDGYDVIFRNYADEIAIVSGGKPITGWSLHENGIYVANSPVADMRQLYINGERAVRARGDPAMIKGTNGDGHLLLDESIKDWNNLNQVEFAYRTLWTLPRVRVDFWNTYQKVLVMQQPAFSYARMSPPLKIGDPTWIENAYELLNEPGEWYLNITNGKLYYMPKQGENMDSIDAIAPFVPTLLNIEGNDTNPVTHLKIQGIQFEHGTWLESNTYGTNFVDLQANVFMFLDGTTRSSKQTPGNIILRYTEGISLENCTFAHLGATGIDLQRGTKNTRFTGNVVKDVSGVGIQIGEMSLPNITPTDPKAVTDNWIINNYITNCSVEYRGGPGIFTGYVRNTRIEHNTISNICYTGISVGWGWSATLTVCANNSVLHNRIYGVMTYLYDGGGIYTLSTQPGTKVNYNVVHDSGWNGLYPDERTNSTEWTGNVVYRCFNTYQNHIMYYDDFDDKSKAYALNDIYNNYFDEDAWFAQPAEWDLHEKPNQIWGVSPGDPDFPQDIVDASGVEPAYRHLIPEDEWYWRFEPLAYEVNPLGKNPVLAWTIIGIFLGIMVIGLIFLGKQINAIEMDKPERLNDVPVGGNAHGE